MTEEKVFAMPFSKVYPALVAKAERKGRTRQEVDEVTCWLTGYDAEGIREKLVGGADLRAFWDGAPHINDNAHLVKGVICGHRVEDIENPIMQNIRRLDKLVDELAKGRPMEKILRK